MNRRKNKQLNPQTSYKKASAIQNNDIENHGLVSENKTIREKESPRSKLSRYGYSIFAIFIFLGGMYSGANYLPKNKFSKDINSTSLSKSLRTKFPYPHPEDFYPAAEFRKQGAILLGLSLIHI